MADRRQIPAEHPRPKVAGGRTRPSKLVKLTALPAVARRQSLNRRLLSATCPFGDTGEPRPLQAADVAILLQMAQERFSGEQALLRRQAVKSLAELRSLEAVEALTVLAASPVEHVAIRGAALQALTEVAPGIAGILHGSLQHGAGVVRPEPTRGRVKRRAPASDKTG